MDHLHKSQIVNLAIAYKLPSITQLDRVQTFIPFNFRVIFFATVADWYNERAKDENISFRKQTTTIQL